MKYFFPRNGASGKARGFTLIELLTVIAIIAILMGLLFPAIGSVKESARKTQAKNDEVQIINAVKAYYTEYGKYPISSQGSDKSYTADGDHSEVLKALTAADTTLNPRKIVFLEVPAVKDLNAPKAGMKDNKFYDPWGKTYGISIDGDYDNSLKNPYTGAGPTALTTGVISWSLGKDGKGGSGTRTSAPAEDDVLSWQ